MSWAESMLKHHCKKRVNDLTNALIEGKHITNGTDIVRYDGINMKIKVEGEWWNTDLNIVLILNRPQKWEVVKDVQSCTETEAQAQDTETKETHSN